MKTFASLLVLLILLRVPLLPQEARRTVTIQPFGMTERLTWTETDDDGTLLVTEQGGRLGGGAHVSVDLGVLRVSATGSGLQGTVGYDGMLSTRDSGRIPYLSRSKYSGSRWSLALGVPVPLSGRSRMLPGAGFRSERWRRTLDAGGPYSYTEDVVASFAEGGVRVESTLRAGLHVNASVRLSYPLSIAQSFSVRPQSGAPYTIVLRPGTRPAFAVEAGFTFGDVALVAKYETWSLRRSDTVNDYYQPESRRELIGLTLGYLFGF